ncbi:MAG: ABC transporter permease [Planctomycetota bacterium]
MRGALYLAGRYLASHPFKTAILVASITLILYLPGGLRVLVARSERQITSRAEATPLLVGMKGSPLELALNSLYFSADVPERATLAAADRVRDTGFAAAIPLYVRFRAGMDPIVGTSLDYFDFRKLRVAEGRLMTRLGDCVVGAAVAERRKLAPGGHVISSPESVFNLAGVYPLKMRVTGVLAPAGTPDDDAVFVDLPTAWVIEGLAHGHTDLSKPGAKGQVLSRDGNVVVGNASVVEYTEITDENVDSFHFHGDPAEFPVTAVIAVPIDEKAKTLLLGRYLDPAERQQILKPETVVSELIDTVLTIQGFVVAALAVVGVATLAVAALVFALSLRLRRREISTLVKIGGSKRAVAAVVSSEIVAVLIAGAALAAALTALTAHFGAGLARTLLG